MPWNTPGGGQGGGPQGPWGRGPSGPQPPDLDELLRKSQERMRRVLPGGGGAGSGRLIAVVAAVGLAIWLGTGFYRVQPDEQGVELVFGRWVNTTTPGLHYNWPTPIGEVYKPAVTKVNRVEIGYRSGTDFGRAAGVREVNAESLMLTGDENIIDIDVTVFWRIKDAGAYLFEIQRPDTTIKSVAESAMRETVGQTPLQFVLTEGRARIEQQTRELMQSVLDTYKSGVEVTQVQLQKVDPPQQVIDAFRDVQAARADQERAQNEAEAYRNGILPRARGEAERLVQEAQAYREQVVADAEGSADRFTSILTAYNNAKDITARRLYLETMEEVLGGMSKIIIEPGVSGNGAGGGQSVVPYLPLDRLIREPQPAARDGAEAAGTSGYSSPAAPASAPVPNSNQPR
ncbi:FtsH protease activity modulator HflK [Tistrella bauzanensis]|nr:FtsH protease activity modulator HflK [Tistrella bauzanensis]